MYDLTNMHDPPLTDPLLEWGVVVDSVYISKVTNNRMRLSPVNKGEVFINPLSTRGRAFHIRQAGRHPSQFSEPTPTPTAVTGALKFLKMTRSGRFGFSEIATFEFTTNIRNIDVRIGRSVSRDASLESLRRGGDRCIVTKLPNETLQIGVSSLAVGISHGFPPLGLLRQVYVPPFAQKLGKRPGDFDPFRFSENSFSGEATR